MNPGSSIQGSERDPAQTSVATCRQETYSTVHKVAGGVLGEKLVLSVKLEEVVAFELNFEG